MSKIWTLDWTHFTPWASLAGGILLGIAVASFVLLNGRVLGISGLVAGLLRGRRGDIGWRASFLLGLLAAPVLYMLGGGELPMRIDADGPMLIAAGLLVGLGTSCASGCTCGHGICGLSRMSMRSVVATLCFMGAAFVTVFVTRHVLT